MTTLEAIGFTVAGGAGSALITFLLFGNAVRKRSCNIAPRCTARHKDVIYNPKARPSKFGWFRSNRQTSENDENNNNNDNEDHQSLIREEVQYRGNPIWGWIPWTLSLSYDTLLNGVPGTGTRKEGMAGSLLKVNMDGIILLRYHAICLKMATLATILGLCIILPMNLTASCDTFELEEGASNANHCNVTEYSRGDLTDYGRTTLANIPSLLVLLVNTTNTTSNNSTTFGGKLSGSLWVGAWKRSILAFSGEAAPYLWRLYGVVFVSWIFVFYLMRLVDHEWVDALALRRVYYLESDHWHNRLTELSETCLDFDVEDSDEEGDEATAKRRLINKGDVGGSKGKMSRPIRKRDPWIPHPEQRETVPNIELYSVLVGQIPSIPSEVIDEHNMEAALGTQANLDWQLNVTISFFDQCVPNQPGFSSSVAAVTILPDAPKLAKAWRTWYKHVGLLRRLRFIRGLISERFHYDIEVPEDIEQGQPKPKPKPIEDRQTTTGTQITLPTRPNSAPDRNMPSRGSNTSLQIDMPAQYQIMTGYDPSGQTSEGTDANQQKSEGFEQIKKRIKYLHNVFGSEYDDGIRTLMDQALSYGPEQTAVYSREFAQGAAACCPHGCREERVRSLDLDDLKELEARIKKDVEASFDALVEAQSANVEGINMGPEINKNHIHDDGSVKRDATRDFEEEKKLYTTSSTPMKKGSMESSYDAPLAAMSRQTTNQSSPTTDMSRQTNNQFIRPHIANIQGTVPVINETDPDELTLGSFGSHRPPLTRYNNFLSSQGKWMTKDASSCAESFGGDDSSINLISGNATTPTQEAKKDTEVPESHDLLDFQSAFGPTRRRLNTGASVMSLNTELVPDWKKVQQIVDDDGADRGEKKASRRAAVTGEWNRPTFSSLIVRLGETCSRFKYWISNISKDAVLNNLRRESTFAVVTFTSRQAAVAARHCLSDGRGAGRWLPSDQIPVPPLADAAVLDLKTCRGCCRPVTLSISERQQMFRRYMSTFLLLIIYVFYTVPITLVGNLVTPKKFFAFFGVEGGLEPIENSFLSTLVSGFVPAILFSLFFALCPVMFKAISNFGSNAVSVNEAEFIALKYYWWFMLTASFSSSYFSTMVWSYLVSQDGEGETLTKVLTDIASDLPLQFSANWCNWIIFRTFFTLPLQYMLQINTYLFQWLGWKCCRRCVMGGGPGGPIPYRIYIDSGVVLLCTVTLTPVAPLIAPAALLYFLYCTPLWRRNCIFMYRPKFDTGGLRWPFLSDIFCTSILTAQILLTTVMALKEALGPAVLAAMPIIYIVLQRKLTRERYLKAYHDAGLLQTSQLDGWDSSMGTSFENREEYRKFLVDAHKAAYVPICIAGGETAALTSEPALVVPMDTDYHHPVSPVQPGFDVPDSDRPGTPLTTETPPLRERWNNQLGATVRRLNPASSFKTDEFEFGSNRSRSYSGRNFSFPLK